MLGFIRNHTYGNLFPAIAIALLCNLGAASLAIAATDADEIDRQHALADKERDLLRQADDLSRDIFELKGTINHLSDQLAAKQDRYRAINHALITIRMEFLQ